MIAYISVLWYFGYNSAFPIILRDLPSSLLAEEFSNLSAISFSQAFPWSFELHLKFSQVYECLSDLFTVPVKQVP